MDTWRRSLYIYIIYIYNIYIYNIYIYNNIYIIYNIYIYIIHMNKGVDEYIDIWRHEQHDEVWSVHVIHAYILSYHWTKLSGWRSWIPDEFVRWILPAGCRRKWPSDLDEWSQHGGPSGSIVLVLSISMPWTIWTLDSVEPKGKFLERFILPEKTGSSQILQPNERKLPGSTEVELQLETEPEGTMLDIMEHQAQQVTARYHQIHQMSHLPRFQWHSKNDMNKETKRSCDVLLSDFGTTGELKTCERWADRCGQDIGFAKDTVKEITAQSDHVASWHELQNQQKSWTCDSLPWYCAPSMSGPTGHGRWLKTSEFCNVWKLVGQQEHPQCSLDSDSKVRLDNTFPTYGCWLHAKDTGLWSAHRIPY